MPPSLRVSVLMLGASASMLMWSTVALLALPALSTAEAVSDWLAPLPVRVTSSGQTAMPDRASEHVKRTVTGPVYQPLDPSVPETTAPLMVGGVLSSLTEAESAPTLPAVSLAWPLMTCPLVSSWTSTSGVIEPGSTPDPRSSSLAVKWTITSSAFQPAAFGVGDRVWVTVGAMLSYLIPMVFLGSWLSALSIA